MRVLVQRASEADVTIDNEIHGRIGAGLVLLVGFTGSDDEAVLKKVAAKVSQLRIFDDENGKMNRSIFDIGGRILSISQFTLYADVSEGRRPSFTAALAYDKASRLYDLFNEELRSRGLEVATGIFGADMQVRLINDGPVTIMVDSEGLK